MKKLLFTFSLAVLGLSCYAQIYTRIKYYDKFDDEVKSEQRKTLITKTDSTFVIEEKGKQPVAYYIIEGTTRGSKDEIVNLINNIYGYQESWCVVRYDKIDKYREAQHNYYLDQTEANYQKVQAYW